MKRSLSKAALFAGALGLATVAIATSPANAQYYYACPDGYYYLEDYGCAPLGYYSAPFIVPGFGFYYGRGWHGGGWHGGGYHGGGGGHGGAHHH